MCLMLFVARKSSWYLNMFQFLNVPRQTFVFESEKTCPQISSNFTDFAKISNTPFVSFGCFRKKQNHKLHNEPSNFQGLRIPPKKPSRKTAQGQCWEWSLWAGEAEPVGNSWIVYLRFREEMVEVSNENNNNRGVGLLLGEKKGKWKDGIKMWKVQRRVFGCFWFVKLKEVWLPNDFHHPIILQDLHKVWFCFTSLSYCLIIGCYLIQFIPIFHDLLIACEEATWANQGPPRRHGPISTEGCCQPVVGFSICRKNHMRDMFTSLKDSKNQTIMIFFGHINDVL